MRKIIIGEKQDCDYRKTCYGIAMMDNKILISYNKNIDEYTLPGGGVELNEGIVEALKREFLEEVGCEILDVSELINVDCFWIKRNGKKMETDAHFFLVRINQVDNFKPLEDFHLPLWVEREKVLNIIEFPYQRKALEFFKENYDKFDFNFN